MKKHFYIFVLIFLFACNSKNINPPICTVDSYFNLYELTDTSICQKIDDLVKQYISTSNKINWNSTSYKYENKYILNANFADSNLTYYNKAFYLGALLADCKYLNDYQKNTKLIENLFYIKCFSDDLKISLFFHFQCLERCGGVAEEDSLIINFYINENIDSICNFLCENNQQDLNILILSGLLIETSNICSQIIENKNDTNFILYLNENKIMLKKLQIILKYQIFNNKLLSMSKKIDKVIL